jgi:hypothetical protein
MSQIPIMPALAEYRGSKDNLRRKAAEHNLMARRVVDHLNTLIANDPSDMQQFIFASVARDLGLTADEVQSAVRYGGHNGITVCVTDEDRKVLARFKSQDRPRS